MAGDAETNLVGDPSTFDPEAQEANGLHVSHSISTDADSLD